MKDIKYDNPVCYEGYEGHIYIYIYIYKLTERTVVLLSAIFSISDYFICFIIILKNWET